MSTSTVDGTTDYFTAAGMTFARAAGPSATLSFMHQDYLGSTAARTTHPAGAAWRKDFTPFGEERLSDAGFEEDMGFTGHIDDDTGLTYMQARYYDPVIGRFLSTDPIGYQD